MLKIRKGVAIAITSAVFISFQNCGQLKPQSFDQASVSSVSSCSFNGQMIASGNTASGFSVATVPFGQSCEQAKIEVSCANGNLSPVTAAPTCSALAGASCAFNGKSIASGGTVEAYQSASVPSGATCIKQTRTCTNGALDGSYAFASCAVNAPLNCSFNGNVVLNGATIQGYPSATVPYGQTCMTETITCTNAVLNPANHVAACSVQPAASCNFNGKTIPSGGTVQGYPTATVPYGQTCKAETITCTNGVLSPANAVAVCSTRPSRAAGIYAPATLGLGEPLAENVVTNGWNLSSQLNAVIALKPKVFRIWVTKGFALSPDGSVIKNSPYVQNLHLAIDTLQKNGIQILVMTADWPSWMTGDTSNSYGSLPCLPTGANNTPAAQSAYRSFLNRYKTSMQNLAAEFNTVQAWEPANETNANGNMHPIPTGAGACANGDTQFSIAEKASITVDVMYAAYASIKAGNSQAVVYMPPIAPINSDGLTVDTSLASIGLFLQYIYNDIKSGVWPSTNPRSFFDGVSWHPYIFADATPTTWINSNNAIYNILAGYGDGAIPIIFSEIGNSTASVSDSIAAQWMANTINLSQQQLPWLKWLIWFRAFNDPSALSWGGPTEVNYGIMTETFQWKAGASTYCQFSFCQNPAAAGVFKARGPGIANWALFWYNPVGGAFCQYQSHQSYEALVGGGNYNSDILTMRTLDPTIMALTYEGYCQ